MSIFDRFKKKKGADKKKEKMPAKISMKKKEITAETKEEKKEKFSTLKPKVEVAAPVKEIKAKKSKKEGSKEAYRVLVKALVTEKAAHLVTQNKYSFAVDKSTNKIEVKKAIESLYGLKPVAVNIINMRGKYVKSGRTSGKKKNWKKAVVTLKPGDKIEIYEGV